MKYYVLKKEWIQKEHKTLADVLRSTKCNYLYDKFYAMYL
jgi:hypothetical protein